MQMVATGAHDHALVVGADMMSSIIDYTRPHDLHPVRRRRGRGGAVAGRRRRAGASSTSPTRSTAAADRRCACRPAAAACRRRTRPSTSGMHYVKQDGQAVFKFAVRKTEEICAAAARAQRPRAVGARSVRLAPGQPPHHQRRRRAPRPARRQGHHQPRTFGNTTGATIPLALADAVADEEAEEGRPGAARVGRRRVYRRRGAAALGLLGKETVPSAR